LKSAQARLKVDGKTIKTQAKLGIWFLDCSTTKGSRQ
jgi:hypothetical protein